MDEYTSERRPISDLINMPQCEQYHSPLMNDFSYFRIVKNSSFAEAISLNYFETLALLKNFALNEKIKQNSANMNIKRSIWKFFEFPTLKMIDIIRNEFSLFTLYLQNILLHERSDKIKTWEFAVDIHQGKVENLFQNNQIDSYGADLIIYIACILGIEIAIHELSPDPNQINRTSYQPELFAGTFYVNRKTSINLLKIRENSYWIIYSKADLQVFANIESQYPNKPSAVTYADSSYFENCGICMNDSQAKRAVCGHYFHSKCLGKQTNCKFCNCELLYKCYICKMEKKIIYRCDSNHDICNNCFISILLNLSDENNSKQLQLLYHSRGWASNIEIIWNIPINDCGIWKIHNGSITEISCINCHNSREFIDFVPISCPDNHEFLCKMCWSKNLHDRKSTCPYNGCEINLNTIIILKYLSVACQTCKKNKPQYFGDSVCETKGCQICYECQFNYGLRYTDQQKIQCILCDYKLTKKTKGWVTSSYYSE